MISGIICEFNPFHAGHKHLIDQVKCHPGDAVVCVMSGNFVQHIDVHIIRVAAVDTVGSLEYYLATDRKSVV